MGHLRLVFLVHQPQNGERSVFEANGETFGGVNAMVPTPVRVYAHTTHGAIVCRACDWRVHVIRPVAQGRASTCLGAGLSLTHNNQNKHTQPKPIRTPPPCTAVYTLSVVAAKGAS